MVGGYDLPHRAVVVVALDAFDAGTAACRGACEVDKCTSGV